MHRRYENQTGTDGAQGAGGGGSNGGGNTAPPARPEYMPETFWNKEKGEANVEGLAKDYTKVSGELATLKKGQVVVPEKYDLKLPEGAVIKPEAIERTAAFAKARGLSQESAAEALNFANGEVKAFQETQVAEHKARVDKWLQDSKEDKEIAGEKGDQFDANTELARKAFRHFGGEALIDELNKTGFGNHPVLVKTFMRIGKAMKSDSLEGGQHGGGQGQKSAADVLYGTQST